MSNEYSFTKGKTLALVFTAIKQIRTNHELL